MAPHAEDPVLLDYKPYSMDPLKPKARNAVPSLDEETTSSATRVGKQLSETYEPGHLQPERHENYAYDYLGPRFPNVHWDELKDIAYEDKGLLGDPRFRNLLDAAEDVFDYIPKIGTEISGLRLTQLTDAQMCDLARLIATRGVVFFRDQDDFDVEAQRELGKFFGTLHKHATTSMPQKEGLEDVHVVYTTDQSLDQRALFTPTYLWHSDVTYEAQPPSYTSLKVLTGPPRGGGGDTLWCSQYAIYDVLSAPMQKYLESLTALHSADEQAEGSRAAGRPVRRDPITTEHPLVRVNPVTGWKSLFFNPGFVTKIVGVPKAESDAVIRYLNELISTTQEAHVRFQWGKHDVAIWDNRCTNHTASYGFMPHRRHAVRVTVTAEKPYFDPAGKSQEEEHNKKWGLPQTNKDGSRRSNYND
ncbi:uncharacterized protein Z520_02010 [Fonsecaea multimorphosa CBS 102226]|uniref:TauD/TfdA-like domain-containing protein n=1 Tax=Fonsecaea multimorphosa CBS 102226 TaxID=1442371 RepID=A0A0D2IXX5_9EURO|nr:uncharacterized protein Z520_02010 [Fonsecaea multimorphosa CBS 102226]KIY01872.1 hypothetical protein Z520_02010 [Fonsecaea multimorphosa CBS 102226]OAL29558.1 hypothetical protein AYO22_01972 [Fonsecaea multimorphosa]